MAIDKLRCRELISKIENGGTSVDISGPATDSTISKVEKQISIEFPLEYCEFLKEFGNIYISGSYIAGIYNNNNFENSEGTVLYEVERFRSDSRTKNDPSFLALSCDGHEWYMGLNVTDGKVYGYDVLSCEYIEQYPSFSIYLEEFLAGLV